MLNDAIKRTKHCRCQFRCLDKNRLHPACNVLVAKDADLLFVSNDTNANCKYSGLSGARPVCSCPTHHALHCSQRLHTTRPPILSREACRPHKPPADAGKVMPQTADAAVKLLMKDMPAEQKATIMKMRADDAGEAASDLIEQIRDTFDLAADSALLLACAREAGYAIEHPEDAAAVILARLVMTLIKEHRPGPV